MFFSRAPLRGSAEHGGRKGSAAGIRLLEMSCLSQEGMFSPLLQRSLFGSKGKLLSAGFSLRFSSLGSSCFCSFSSHWKSHVFLKGAPPGQCGARGKEEAAGNGRGR